METPKDDVAQPTNWEEALLRCLQESDPMDKAQEIITSEMVKLTGAPSSEIRVLLDFARGFKKRAETVTAQRPLVAFLRSGRLATGPDLYMPFSEFWHMYKSFCKDYMLPTPNASATRHDTVMGELGLVFVRDGRALAYPRNSGCKPTVQAWVLGADIASDPQ